MFSRPAVAIFIVIVAEYLAAARFASLFGFGTTVLALLALSALGIVVLRWKAAGLLVSTLESLGVEARRAEVADRALGLLAGVLLVVPGFVTATLGLLLLLAPVRRAVEPLVLARTAGWSGPIVNRVGGQGGRRGGGRVGDDTIIDVDIVEPDASDASRSARPEIS